MKSMSPYSQSKYIQEKRTKNETPDEFEKRSWMQRCHFNEEGRLFIPGLSFKNCLSESAKYKATKIPGKGNQTYTKHIDAGVLVLEDLVLDYTKDTIDHQWLHVPSDGKRGGSKRVLKCFPLVRNWEGTITFHILDEIINEEVFKSTLEDAGAFIGIGRFRPRNNGTYGRFAVESVKWVG